MKKKPSKTEADGTPGRPTKCTPEVTKKIVEALQSGAYLPQCCAVAGVDYSNVKEWMRRGRKGDQPFSSFRATIRDAMREREVRYAALVSQAAEKDPKAAQWMLTHRYSKRWADREKVEAEVATKSEVRHIYVPRKKTR